MTQSSPAPAPIDAGRLSVAGIRRSIASAAPFGLAVVVVTGVFAVASLYLARTLPTADYGRVAFGLNVHLLLLTLAGFGLSSGVMAEVARARQPGGVRWSNVEALFTVRAVSILVLPMVGAAWSIAVGTLLPFLASITAAIFITQDFFVAIMAGQLRIGTAALVTSVQPVLYLGLLLGASVSSAEEVLLALGVALAASLGLALALTGGLAIRRDALRRVSLGQVAGATAVARIAYTMTLLQIGHFVAPIIILGGVGRYDEAATLSIALALVRIAPEVLAIVVNAVYFPRVTAVGAGSAAAGALFTAFVRLLALIGIPATLGIVLLGEPILSLLFAGKYDHAVPHMALASGLVLMLPVEALLSWTLVASGAGRMAVVALGLRLTAVLAGSVAFVVLPDAPLEMIVGAYLAGSIVSLLIQVRPLAGRWPLRMPIPALTLYAGLIGAACFGLRALLAGDGAWPTAGGVALVGAGAAFVGIGILLTSPGGLAAELPVDGGAPR